MPKKQQLNNQKENSNKTNTTIINENENKVQQLQINKTTELDLPDSSVNKTQEQNLQNSADEQQQQKTQENENDQKTQDQQQQQQQPTVSENQNQDVEVEKQNQTQQIQQQQTQQEQTPTEEEEEVEPAEEIMSQNAVIDDNLLLWGHYKPHLIYSISQRNTKTYNPIAINMGYRFSEYRNLYYHFNDRNENSNIHFDFIMNDGTKYSENQIKDDMNNIKIVSKFLKKKATEDEQYWAVQHKYIPPTPEHRKRDFYGKGPNFVSLNFAIQIEVYEQSRDENIFIRVKKQPKYWYEIEFFSIVKGIFTNEENSLGFLTIQFKDGSDEVQAIDKMLENQMTGFFLKENHKSYNWRSKEHLVEQMIPVNLNIKGNQHTLLTYTQNNYEQNHASLMGLNFIFKVEESAEIFMQFHSKQPKILLDFQKNFEDHIATFKQRFEQKFDEEFGMSQAFNKQCAASSLSNLLGGMTYKYGNLQFTQQEEQYKQHALPIFSFTPSRKRFSWSFLWDDGFHNAIACRWEPQLCLKVIDSWLSTMNDQGWIPREQTRGTEAEGLCNCPGFLLKDNRDGNPPSLLLGLEYLSRKKQSNDGQSQQQEGNFIRQFLRDHWQELDRWFNWYFDSQRNEVRDEFVFRWWDKNGHQSSMNSGLDDYPRNNENYNQRLTPLGHIDAQSWMYFFADMMERLAGLLEDQDLSVQMKERYRSRKELIKYKGEQLFFDKQSKSYKDILTSNPHQSLSSSSNSNTQAGGQGQQQQQENQVVHSEHEGYPSLLPLAFGMIEKDSQQLDGTLDLIYDSNRLWTPYGLRSLSQQSSMFMRGNNYWTNPIWININYLVLRGLKLYYVENNNKARQIYEQLRENVMHTVCGTWDKSGFFFENYNQGGLGEGSCSYPFTGWTALISLIINESY